MQIFAALAAIWKKFQYYFYQKKVNTAVDEIAAAKTDEDDIHALQDFDGATFGPAAPEDPSAPEPPAPPPTVPPSGP